MTKTKLLAFPEISTEDEIRDRRLMLAWPDLSMQSIQIPKEAFGTRVLFGVCPATPQAHFMAVAISVVISNSVDSATLRAEDYFDRALYEARIREFAIRYQGDVDDNGDLDESIYNQDYLDAMESKKRLP